MAWTFSVYVGIGGSDALQREINRITASCRQHFSVRLRYLAVTAKIDWNRPHAAKLVGWEDIYEIRFKADNVQVRPLGFFGPANNEFTILVWAIEKGNVYKPHDCFKTAARRRKEVRDGKAGIARLQIFGEDFSPD